MSGIQKEMEQIYYNSRKIVDQIFKYCSKFKKKKKATKLLRTKHKAREEYLSPRVIGTSAVLRLFIHG